MASTPVEIQAPSGRTLSLELYPLGSDTIANTGGDSLTEHTNRKGFYQATVTESLSGWHHVLVKDGSTPILVGYIYLTDTTSVHRTEAPPWSQLEGRVTVEVDLVDAPNADAITAIQNGLSTFDASSDSVTLAASQPSYAPAKAGDAMTLSAGAITASVIATNAIDADAIAADAVTAIQSGLATASALSTTDGKIDGIKAVTDALPDAGALSSLATATALQTVDDNVDAIKAVTDNLPDSGALSSLATASALATVDNVVDAILEDTGTTLPSSLAGIEAKVDTVDSVADAIKAVTDQLPDSGALSSLATASALATVDGVADAIKAVTDQLPDGGALSSLATASALASVSGNVTAVKAATDNLPDSGALTSLAAKTDLPANFADLSITATTGRVEVEANHDKTGYALTSDYDAAKTAAQAGDEMALTSGALAAVNAAADQALSDYDPPTRAEATADKDEILGAVEEVDGVADAILDAVETDGVAITSTTMQAIADALLDRANAIDGATPRAALRYIAAVLAGKVTGAGTGTEKFLGLDGTTPRVEVTVDDDGNRSAVEYDPA